LLRWRLISAAVILAALFALMWLDYAVGPTGTWLAPLLLLMALASTQELLDMTSGPEGHVGEQTIRPVSWTVYCAVTMVVLAATLPPILQLAALSSPQAIAPRADLAMFGLPLVALMTGIALVMFGEVWRYRQPGGVLASVALSVFIVAYVAVPMTFVAGLRFLGGNELGMAALLCAALVVKCSDIGQYAFGRALGRNKLTPRLSPKKTIEGAVGGVIVACAVAWASFTFLVPLIAPGSNVKIPWWQSLLFGVLVALAGMLGDLAVSIIKRDTGRKDSSRWLPGLGGVLDILDSVLLAAPAAYLWWVLRGA
jgi:phosphatidate cytidylyltransferase